MSLTVLGVDPGTRYTGWGIVEGAGSSILLVAAGTIRCEAGDVPFPAVLRATFRALGDVIRDYRPAEVAVEEAFVHRNALAALRTGGVRGIALLAAAEAELPVGEYNPRQVKQAIAGRGSATKEQVAYMVRAIMEGGGRRGRGTAGLDGHALDALAIAICHLWRRDRPVRIVAGALAEARR